MRILDAMFEPASDFDAASSKYRHGLIAVVPPRVDIDLTHLGSPSQDGTQIYAVVA